MNELNYSIDPGTGEYRRDEKGEYLRAPLVKLADGAVARFDDQTDIAPIPRGNVGEFEIVILKGGAPEIQEDHRGRKLYSTMDGSSVEMKEIGPLPNGVTDKERPSPLHDWNQEEGDWAPNRYRVIKVKFSEIKTQLTHRLEKGGFEAFGTWHSLSERASNQIVSMRQSIILGKFREENWITLFGVDLILTKEEDVETIYEAGAQRTRDIYSAFKAHKAKILSRNFKTESLLSYDTSREWPMSFTEYLESEKKKLLEDNDDQ